MSVRVAGTIVGSCPEATHYLHVVVDGDTEPIILHPSWKITYHAADESLTEEGGVNESSSGVHGQQMSPLPSPENDRSGRASASTSPPAVSDLRASAAPGETEQTP